MTNSKNFDHKIQSLYQKAMRFAGEKHHDQMVPGSDANYLLHISNVTMEVLVAWYEARDFDIHLALPVAILHDTIEDTSATFDEIRDNFGVDVARGVQALTKDSSLSTKEEKMQDSLDRILASPREVAIVKLADRITNLQPPPEHWDREKVKRYWEEGKLIAKTLKGRCGYLDGRISEAIGWYREELG